MVSSHQAVMAAQRTQFIFFLVKAFETLHPGQKPLDIVWYLESICHVLDEVKAGSISRLAITVPPRHLKSITVAVAWVAWRLGHDPAMKIMVASYSQDLARLHSEQCRTIMETDWYQRLFPETRISARGNRALELVTTRGGSRKAVSVGGSVTGHGADIIIVDDCMKADDVRSPAMREEVKAWFQNTLLTRLNDKGAGAIVSIQQRLHEDDLPAMLLSQGYFHLNLPAIAEKIERLPIGRGRIYVRDIGNLLNPARESVDTLEQIRRELGPVAFSAQYQQEPTTPGGNLLRLEWFGTYDDVLDRHHYIKIVQSWDTGMSSAPTSDYSVCTTWGFTRDNEWHLIDVYRDRLDYPDLKRAVIRQQRRYQADKVIIEDAGSGKSVFQDLRAQGPFLPLLWRVDTDKENRLIGCLGEIEAGYFHLPESAPWLEPLRAELRAFPNGRHDDQVDSMTQFIQFQRQKWKWVMTPVAPDGRPERIVRLTKRPW